MNFYWQRLVFVLLQLTEITFFYFFNYCQVIGFVYGFVKQDVLYMLYIFGVGVALALVICVPAWGFLYNRNPQKWLPPIVVENSNASGDSTTPAAPEKPSKFLQ